MQRFHCFRSKHDVTEYFASIKRGELKMNTRNSKMVPDRPAAGWRSFSVCFQRIKLRLKLNEQTKANQYELKETIIGKACPA